jgi:hypothetical protein
MAQEPQTSYDDEDAEAPATPSQAHQEVHTEALIRFGDITSAVQEERALALSDRRFATIAGAQWEGEWGDQWANSIMVEVNKTSLGVDKIIENYRANRITVNYRGIDKGADEQTAETMNGMYRADLYASKGQQALDNAFEEAVQGGIGAWRLVNRYSDEYDPEDDTQRIAFEAIVDADQSVFWDMNAKLYDKSDARFCFVVTAMSRQAFDEEYGADRVSDWPDEILKVYYDWYTPDVVRVVEYYVVEDKGGTLRIFRNRATGEERREWASDLTPELLTEMEYEGWRLVRERKAKRRQVVKYTMSGSEVLKKPQVIAGQCIPVVPVYGKRWFIDNMERSRGHVRLAKDPQRIYNAQISKLSETASIAPTERPIFTPEQIAGHETSWAEANINRAPYSLINPLIGVDGNPMPAGPVSMVTPPQLPPVLSALIQITANDITELTSSDDGASEVRSNVSAEAMDIAATRTDAKFSIYMDNMRQSVQRGGEIWQSMARDVYFEEGREVETMGDDGEQGTAILSEPFTDDRGRFSIRNDIAKGKYRVISDVTEATATRRDKTVKTLVTSAQVVQPFDPELAGAMMNTALLNMDGEGVQDLQEWVRARGVTAGYVKPTKEEAEQMAQAQENQQPSPQDKALNAVADKEGALAGKAVADTELSRAKTVETLANAEKLRSETGREEALTGLDQQERRVGIVDRVRTMFSPKPKAGAAA